MTASLNFYKNFFVDLQAGLTLSLVSVPTSVAYATLAGLPGIRGLTKLGPSLIVFGLLTRVKWLASGATSLTAVTVKGDLAGFNLEGNDYIELVCLYSLMVGAASVAMALFRLGAVAKAIPKPVMSGFKWGAACVILFSQAPDCVLGEKKEEMKTVMASIVGSHVQKLLDATETAFPVPLSGANGFGNLVSLFTNPQLWKPVTTGIAAFTIWFIRGGKSLIMPSSAPQGSEVLLVCVLATFLSLTIDYSKTYGSNSVIGPNVADNAGEIDESQAEGGVGKLLLGAASSLVPSPLYWTQLPWEFAKSAQLWVKAFIFSCVDFSATVSICATFEAENGMEWDANHELMVQGVSNVAAGLSGSQPVGGSLTRSLVTRLTNAFSPRAAVINGLCMMLMLPVLWIVEETPKAVLAAVVLSQVISTVLDEKRSLRNLTGTDRLLGFSTAFATAFTSPTIGIIFGCVFSGIVKVVYLDKRKDTKKV